MKQLNNKTMKINKEAVKIIKYKMTGEEINLLTNHIVRNSFFYSSENIKHLFINNVFGGFIWDYTKEGYDFWENIDNRFTKEDKEIKLFI